MNEKSPLRIPLANRGSQADVKARGKLPGIKDYALFPERTTNPVKRSPTVVIILQSRS